jgi:hypothetical protein
MPGIRKLHGRHRYSHYGIDDEEQQACEFFRHARYPVLIIKPNFSDFVQQMSDTLSNGMQSYGPAL